MNLFNNGQNLSDGIGVSITKAIYKAIEYKQNESVQKLVDFVRKILIQTFNSNINVYNQFIVIPSYYYYKGYTSGNFVSLGTDAASTLTDLIRFVCIFSIEKTESLEELKKTNQVVYQTFKGYSQLFYQIVNNRDYKTFEKVMDKYRIAYLHDNLNYPKYLTNQNLDIRTIEDNYYEDIKEYRALSDYHRRIKFAVLSWLWFLYDKSQISKEDLLKFTTHISFERVETKDLINDLIFFNTYSLEKFDWNRWDYLERKELKVYSPPQPEDWLTFGFALYCLKDFNPYNFEYEFVENTELTRWLPEKLNKCFNKIKEEKEKWLEVNWPEKERRPDDKTINVSIEKILTPFKNLKRRYERSVNKVILNQDLSEDKINSFKAGIYKAFHKNSAIKEAFDLFKNIECVKSIPDQNKERIGYNTDFTKAKMMFVEDNHQFIFGTDDWGALIAREIDNRFINKVLSLKQPKQYSDLNKAIEDSIKLISNRNYSATLIMIGSNLSYTDKGLMNNPNYTPSWQLKEKRESVFDVGFFKDIPILSIFSKEFDNKALICDFESFVFGKEWCDENNYQNVLDIEVKTISDDEALRIYNSNPNDWTKNEDGVKLEKDEALEMIKLNMHIKILYEVLFEFIEIDAYEICSIDNK